LSTVKGTKLRGNAGHNLDLMTDNARSDTSPFFSVLPQFGLEVNADKTKYMIMSRDQNAG